VGAPNQKGGAPIFTFIEIALQDASPAIIETPAGASIASLFVRQGKIITLLLMVPNIHAPVIQKRIAFLPADTPMEMLIGDRPRFVGTLQMMQAEKFVCLHCFEVIKVCEEEVNGFETGPKITLS